METRTVLLSSIKKCRGRKAALNELVSLVCDNIVEPEKQIIGIAHADAYEDSLYVMDKIQEKNLCAGIYQYFLRFLYRKPCGTGYHRLVLYGKRQRIRGRQISLP